MAFKPLGGPYSKEEQAAIDVGVQNLSDSIDQSILKEVKSNDINQPREGARVCVQTQAFCPGPA